MKKGFTFVEMLAIIIVLSIIILIAVPSVYKLLDESKMNSFETSVKNIEKKVVEECTTQTMSKEEVIYYYKINNNKISPKIELTGELPEGEIYLDEKCRISYSLYTRDYYSYKEFNDSKAELDNTQKDYTLYNNGTAIYYNPEANTRCSVDDYNSNINKFGISGCMKWYTYNDSKSSRTVNMILDHNIALEYYNESGDATKGPTMQIKKLNELTMNWTKGINPNLISAFDIAKISKHKTFNKDSSASFYLGTNSVTDKSLVKNYLWLYDNLYNCSNCNNIGLEINGFNYSTLTPNYTNFMWAIFNGQVIKTAIYFNTNHIKSGIRPVITLSKDRL